MTAYIEMDDFRQTWVVAKNEALKFVSGRRFLVYVILMALTFGLITFLPYVFGGSIGNTPGKVLSHYVSFIGYLVLLAATLFASVTIVSEFEERTALIVFPRPVKKTTFFVGKLLACFVLEAVMIVAFYACVALVSLIAAGSVPFSALTSLGMALIYVFAASGIATMISSLMKKGSTSAILTFVVLLLIIPIVSGVMSSAGNMNAWFMLDQASTSISYCVPEYLAQVNQTITDIMTQLGMDPTPYLIKAPDLIKAAGAMIAWGLVGYIIAWRAFLRREF